MEGHGTVDRQDSSVFFLVVRSRLNSDRTSERMNLLLARRVVFTSPERRLQNELRPQRNYPRRYLQQFHGRFPAERDFSFLPKSGEPRESNYPSLAEPLFTCRWKNLFTIKYNIPAFFPLSLSLFSLSLSLSSNLNGFDITLPKIILEKMTQD